MSYDSTFHHRRSIRLKHYDYTSEGAYFVTLCAHLHQCLFGEIVEGKHFEKDVRLNVLGQIAEQEWLKTPSIRPDILLDAFVIMPNHVHGIIIMTSLDENGVVGARRRLAPTATHQPSAFGRPPAQSLSSAIGAFKSIVARRINVLRSTPGGLLWQRNYYEHIIRNELDLERIRTYIANNPARWGEDEYNPDL